MFKLSSLMILIIVVCFSKRTTKKTKDHAGKCAYDEFTRKYYCRIKSSDRYVKKFMGVESKVFCKYTN